MYIQFKACKRTESFCGVRTIWAHSTKLCTPHSKLKTSAESEISQKVVCLFTEELRRCTLWSPEYEVPRAEFMERAPGSVKIASCYPQQCGMIWEQLKTVILLPQQFTCMIVK